MVMAVEMNRNRPRVPVVVAMYFQVAHGPVIVAACGQRWRDYPSDLATSFILCRPQIYPRGI